MRQSGQDTDYHGNEKKVSINFGKVKRHFQSIIILDMSNLIQIEEIDQREIIPGFLARFVHSEHLTISYWEIKKGSRLPEHQHHHEQISQVMDGKFELTINGIANVMTPGKVAVIPSNAMHAGVALTDCKVMDIFCPVREDYKS